MAMNLENRKERIENRGFTLLIAIIFMSVMLSFGLALGSLGYKQEVLASNAIESQHAFYAADAALECALYADQQQNLFEYSSHGVNTPPGLMSCAGAVATQLNYSYDATKLVVAERISIDSGTSYQRCADVTIYKYSTPVNGVVSYLFSQGYDVACASVGGSRFVSRGLSAHY